jgi:hypothetical protein
LVNALFRENTEKPTFSYLLYASGNPHHHPFLEYPRQGNIEKELDAPQPPIQSNTEIALDRILAVVNAKGCGHRTNI